MFRSGGLMVSRRRFLQVGTVAASATLASQAVAQKNSDAGSGALPSSIAALKSMKDKAQPITNQERAARRDN
jgi:hypothetical protein